MQSIYYWNLSLRNISTIKYPDIDLLRSKNHRPIKYLMFQNLIHAYNLHTNKLNVII